MATKTKKHPHRTPAKAPRAPKKEPPRDVLDETDELAPISTTVSLDAERDQLPVAEPGLPVEPEDMGRQFLSSATDQDNFETELRDHGTEPGDVDLSSDVVKEGSLFDQPSPEGDETDVEEPDIRADDNEHFESDEDEREREMERTRRTLEKGRGGTPRA